MTTDGGVNGADLSRQCTAMTGVPAAAAVAAPPSGTP